MMWIHRIINHNLIGLIRHYLSKRIYIILTNQCVTIMIMTKALVETGSLLEETNWRVEIIRLKSSVWHR